MTKKKLALRKAWFSLAIIIAYLTFCTFFFTYGRAAFQRAANKLGEKQAFGGLGPAIALVFAIIALVCFAVPAVMFLISAIGNFKCKGGKLLGFTIVSLVAEILAIAVLFFLSLFTFDGTLYDAVVIAVTGVFDLVVLASFVDSIIVLVKRKTAADE